MCVLKDSYMLQIPAWLIGFKILRLFILKGRLFLPFICLRPDVHHSLHINHQSVAPFSPPPALNLFTCLSFPFLYRESRLIRRSLGLIFIKGSREGELAGGGGRGWLLQLFFICRAGTKDKWILVFCTFKTFAKKIFFETTMCQISEGAEPCQSSRDNYKREKKEIEGQRPCKTHGGIETTELKTTL